MKKRVGFLRFFCCFSNFLTWKIRSASNFLLVISSIATSWWRMDHGSWWGQSFRAYSVHHGCGRKVKKVLVNTMLSEQGRRTACWDFISQVQCSHFLPNLCPLSTISVFDVDVHSDDLNLMNFPWRIVLLAHSRRP